MICHSNEDKKNCLEVEVDASLFKPVPMPTIDQLYWSTKWWLSKVAEQKDRLQKAKDEKTLAKLNLDSARATVTSELDSDPKVSKASIKNRVEGAQDVQNAKRTLEDYTNEEKMAEHMIDLFDSQHKADKKAMGIKADEIKGLGG